ncbi:hypothetical protein DU52_20265 [Methanosarcina mazei]|uniref:Glycosyltransferase RgtA/B/C/D-like domain-containing protein n=2 Tax=Methanosarcina mazei TaxID=2209 RepID=A0A0F8F5M2_METMZ|nr:hypothetical protein DU52_20265 [Methanosarcina mazei]
MQGNSSSNFDIQYNPSRRTKFQLMGLLLALNIIIRIPSIPHEKGYDSFFIHTLANSISSFGEAKWWINWMSIFGLYPNSYSSAVPFTLSGISQVMGIEMEKTILFFCVIIGIFGMFTAYVFAERIYNNFLFKYTMSLFFSLAPGFMLFTTWEVSTRGQFVAFFPLFIYILLKEDLKIKKYILSLVCFIFIFSTHNYAYFLVPISGLYILLKITQKIKPEFFKNPHIGYIFVLLFIASLIYPFFTGLFISSGSRYSWVLGAITTNIRQTGPLMLFLPGGLIYIFLKKKTLELMFMSLITILLAPIFYSQIYGPFILILIFVFLVSVAYNNFLKVTINSKHKLLTLGVIITILFLVSFSSFYNHYRTGGSDSFWYMQESTYASGMWAKNHVPENTRGLDTGFETGRFFAISEGHPITISQDPANLAYGWINESDMVIEKNSPMSLNYYFDGPYSVKGGTTFIGSIEWLKYTANKIRTLKEFDYFIQDKNQYRPVDDVVEREASMIFDSPRISIWKIPS